MDKKKKRKIITIVLVTLLLILLTVGITLIVLNLTSKNKPNNDPFPTELVISEKGKDSALDKLDIVEESNIELDIKGKENEMVLTYKLEVSDTSIAKVEGQNIIGLKPGSTFLTITCIEEPSLTKTIIINITDKVIQKGVGSGTSSDDPIFIGNEGSQEPLEIYFIELNRMYGDAVYIKKGLLDILIDAGTSDDGADVRAFLESHMEDKTLDLVMVSHTHEDHYGGMAEALKAVDNVSMFIDYGGDSKNTYSNARDLFIANGSKHFGAKSCVEELNGAVKEWYLTKDLKCNILDTGHYISDTGSAQNPESVAAIFEYQDFSYFTAGDLTSDSELSLISREDLKPVSLYKASHHGSHGSNTTDILDILDPYMVGISAAITGSTPESQSGKGGHPAEAAIERIFKAPQIRTNHNVYWNGVNGSMCFTTYGGAKDVTCKGSPTRKGYYIKDENGNLVKVTGEENLKFIDTKLFKIRGYDKYVIA